MQNLEKVQSTVLTQFELSKKLLHSGILSENNFKPSTRLVLISLVSHYPNIFPSEKTIAFETGISLRNVERCIQELKEKNIILITYTGRSNKYNFTPYFFSLFKMSNQVGQNEQKTPSICRTNKESIKIIKKPFRDFSNKTSCKVFLDNSKEPDYLKYRENALITMNSYHKFNLKTDREKEILRTIQEKWSFTISEAPILEFI